MVEKKGGKKMDRIKTFAKYVLWVVGLYLFTMFCTYVGFHATYKNISLVGELPTQVTINLAQATTVNGRIYGEVTSNEQNNLNGKYIKVGIYTKTGNFAGTKYLKIEDTKINEPKKFAVYFTAENIASYTVEIVEATEETEREVQTAMDLFGDTFTNEELKTYAVVTLILALILI